MRKIFIPLTLFSILLFGAAIASAQTDWVKLGEKDVDFSIDHDTIGAESKGTIREVRLSVMYAPIKFTKVVINYMDGQKQELEYLEDVKVGTYSRTITIEGDGHPIKDIDFWYETATMMGQKAKVMAFGRS